MEDQTELVTVVLSDKTTVKLKELSGDEQFDVDAMLPGTPNQFVIASSRAAASVREINGEPFPRPTEAESVRRVLRRLTGRELDTLMIRWAELFGVTATEDAAKN